jgi:hypothetical protein
MEAKKQQCRWVLIVDNKEVDESQWFFEDEMNTQRIQDLKSQMRNNNAEALYHGTWSGIRIECKYD